MTSRVRNLLSVLRLLASKLLRWCREHLSDAWDWIDIKWCLARIYFALWLHRYDWKGVNPCRRHRRNFGIPSQE